MTEFEPVWKKQGWEPPSAYIHVWESIQRIPVLRAVFDRLFPYQLNWLFDFSKYRAACKSRRIGWSWVGALDVVLTTSGIWEALGAPIITHNYNVISKREDPDAKDFMRYCQRFARALALDADEEETFCAPYVISEKSGTTHLEFKKSGYRIQIDTQSPLAGRGGTGHLLKDEAAWYKYAREIVAGADKSVLASKLHRLSEFSTPNGTSGMGEVFYLKHTCSPPFKNYSVHSTNLIEAIEQGFDGMTIQQARDSCLSEDEFNQEFLCKFLGSGDEYFDLGLLQQAEATPPARAPDRAIVGIDVASVVDLTALVVLEQYGYSIYAGDTYLISGVPYASSTGVMGQEDIVHALLRHIRPTAAIMDATSDGAELYARVMSKEIVCPMQPHQFNRNGRAWKEAWVPRLRTAIEEGSVMFAPAKTRVYQSGQANSAHDAAEFVDVAFKRHHNDILKLDFMKVRKKLLQTGVSFDTVRDASGHGDSFWAACMGFSLCDSTARRRQQPKRAPKKAESNDMPVLPNYVDFL